MSEQINRLITKADTHAWSIADKYVPECGEVNYIWEDAFREKFAELIIQDCAKVCADNGMRAGGAGTIVGETFLDASKLIRGNFGLDTFGVY